MNGTCVAWVDTDGKPLNFECTCDTQVSDPPVTVKPRDDLPEDIIRCGLLSHWPFRDSAGCELHVRTP